MWFSSQQTIHNFVLKCQLTMIHHMSSCAQLTLDQKSHHVQGCSTKVDSICTMVKTWYISFGHPSHNGNPNILGISIPMIMDWWPSPNSRLTVIQSTFDHGWPQTNSAPQRVDSAKLLLKIRYTCQLAIANMKMYINVLPNVVDLCASHTFWSLRIFTKKRIVQS